MDNYNDMSKEDFAKTVKIYKSHDTQYNSRMAITYANKLSPTTMSSQKTIDVAKNGGALNSLWLHFCG
jgi:hypothetical protein